MSVNAKVMNSFTKIVIENVDIIHNPMFRIGILIILFCLIGNLQFAGKLNLK